MSDARQSERVNRLRAGVVLIALSLAQSAPVAAEEWLLVPVGDGEAVTRLGQTLAELETNLAQQGVSTRNANDAAERFQQVVSSPPQKLSEAQIEEWSRRSQRALGLLARNDYRTALEELDVAQTLSRDAVEVLNRDPVTAVTLLNTCLFTVRALLGVGKRATARVQAEECARLSPGAEPDVKMHPPSIRAFYDDVVDASRSNAGTLEVESQPSGCGVWVNGVSFGLTPARVERLVSGAYAVQVECDAEAGRVHRASVERGTTETRLDTLFDQAVQTDEQISLHYREPPSRARLTRDAETLVAALEVDAVVLVSVGTGEAPELTRVGASGERTSARAWTSLERPDGAALAVAIDTLLGKAPPISPRQRPPHGQFVAGVTLASLGSASLLTGYALYAVSTTRLADQMVTQPSNDNQAQWLNTRFGMFYVGSFGAGMLVAAMPLALPHKPKTPWWGWLSGGAGLALAATSIALAGTAPPTPDVSRVVNPQGYVDRAKRTDAAFLLGVTAAPLLTMPLVYLLRRDDKRRRAQLEPRAVAGRSGGFLGIAGSY